MSQFSSSPMQPLSIGNVVTAGLRIYRSHFKSYFLLALKAYLWVLVPVYGWAKLFAIAGLLSRLSFSELVNQPESIEAGSRFVNSRLWQFLIAVLLMFLVGLGIGVGFIILIGIISAIFAALSAVGNLAVNAIAALIAIVVTLAFTIGILWLLARFFIVEVPLAIEDDINATSTISRSWELTKGFAWRLLGISLVAYLIALPIQIAIQVGSSIIQIILASLSSQAPLGSSLVLSTLNTLISILILGLILSSGALILPFWQAIKAVVYYDLRTRREGLGLKLRDRNI